MSTLAVGHLITFSQSDIAIHAEILAIMIHFWAAQIKIASSANLTADEFLLCIVYGVLMNVKIAKLTKRVYKMN